MNNRKPRNKRGALTRQNFRQETDEPEFIYVDRKKVPNPRFGQKRFITHAQTPKYNGMNLWGSK